MREEQTPGAARQDGRKGRIPQAEIDIWRRRGRKNERAVLDADPGGVSDEGNAAVVVEIADMVGGVPRGIDHVELAHSEGEGLAAFEDAKIFRRHREGLAEQARQVGTPQAGRAGEQLRRVGHVRRAVFMDVHGKPRIFSDERAGSAGVVQVNVGQKNRVQIGGGKALGMQQLAELGERRARAGVNEGAMAVGLQQRRSYGPRPTGPMGVEDCDCAHGSFSVAQGLRRFEKYLKVQPPLLPGYTEPALPAARLSILLYNSWIFSPLAISSGL